MCGIYGVYQFDGKPVDTGVLREMGDLLRHRGPDQDGLFVRKNVALGIQRLAVIDLNTGDQPIYNEDKTVQLVLNGEIYNFQELRASLETRHRFRTKSDTEVIAHLYEDRGERCVNRLRGMFAFALWDDEKEKLFIARDRVGKKPLYYTVQNGALVFASEIRAIVRWLGKTPEIDREAIDLFLTYQYVPSPHTIYKGIHSLLPGHTLTCGKSGMTAVDSYWEIDYTRKTEMNFAEACAQTRELLTEATKLRMTADVPLGAFLSGGHDSSIVVGLMSSLSSTPVKTFSIGFEEDGFSELPYAARVARRFNTDHHEFILKPHFIDLLPKIVWHYGQPFSDSSALPSYLVSRETRKSVTVALNGDGGDESFGGYLRYKAMKGSFAVSPLFRALGRRGTELLASLIPHTETASGRNVFNHMERLISGLAEPPAVRNLRWHSIFSAHDRELLYTREFHLGLAHDADDYLVRTFECARARTLMDRTFYTDIMTYLPECLLVKMDIASMANSLEARSPFLDHHVMEFAAALPDSWKVHGLTTKYILRQAFKDLLPREINARGKQGFGIPVGLWFRTEWRDFFRETVLSANAVRRGYFKKDALQTIYDEHISGRKDHGYRMFALLMLELWHLTYIDGKLHAR